MYILESTLPASVAHADPVPSLNPAILFLPTNSYSHHPDIYTASTDCSQASGSLLRFMCYLEICAFKPKIQVLPLSLHI